MKRSAKGALILCTLAVGLLLGPAPGALGAQWQLSSDFRPAPSQSNPNPDSFGNPAVWEFLQGSVLHSPANYSLLGQFIPNAFGVDGLEQWEGTFNSTGPLDLLPAEGMNILSTEQFPSTISWPPFVFRVHPLANDAAIVGWHSPVFGNASVNVGLTEIDGHCGDGIGWFVDKEGATIASGEVPKGGSGNVSLTTPVNAGNTLYFIVTAGANNDYGCDSTGLSITIQAG